jgi:hypothetical protein
MRLMLESIFKSIRMLLNTTVVFCFYLVLFVISGIQFYSKALRTKCHWMDETGVEPRSFGVLPSPIAGLPCALCVMRWRLAAGVYVTNDAYGNDEDNSRGRYCGVNVGMLKGLWPPYSCDAARNETCLEVEEDPEVYNFDSFGQVRVACCVANVSLLLACCTISARVARHLCSSSKLRHCRDGPRNTPPCMSSLAGGACVHAPVRT